jgi:hypothetical protein
MATHGDPYRKLTKEESELRNRADRREFKQRCIDTIVDLKISYVRLIALLNRNKLPDTDRYPISSDPIRYPWAELETLLLYTADVPRTKTLLPNSLLPTSLQLPITGDIPLKDVTQGQPSKQTTDSQNTLTEREQKQQEIILHGQEVIRQFFHAQETKHMPDMMKMSLKDNMLIGGLLDEGKYFPDTSVLVKFDLALEEGQIICE